jgi:hypothetical protein
MYKLIKPPVFTGAGNSTALDAAAAWLAEHCFGGFEPVNLRAYGSTARVTLTREHDELVIFRRTAKAKSK